MNDTIFYCDECGNEENYEVIHKMEEVTIKDVTFKNEHEYCQCSVCKELYEPLDDVDKNIKSDYAKYREIKHLLSPEDITSIREKYALSQRQFAELLGISHSTLSRVENGALQTEYQNSLFVLSNSPSGFKQLVLRNLDTFKEDEKESLLDTLTVLIGLEIKEYKKDLDLLVCKIDNIYEYMNNTIRNVNIVKSDIDSVKSDIKELHETINNKHKGDEYSWKEPTQLKKLFNPFNILRQY